MRFILFFGAMILGFLTEALGFLHILHPPGIEWLAYCSAVLSGVSGATGLILLVIALLLARRA